MKAAAVGLIAGVLAIVYGVTAFFPDSAADRGREVYAAQKCALCHSIAGVGGPKLALDQVGSKLKPEVMKRWITTPKEMKADSTMKPYPNLPEKDLNDLIAFLTGLK
jgi:cytochrome c2